MDDLKEEDVPVIKEEDIDVSGPGFDLDKDLTPFIPQEVTRQKPKIISRDEWGAVSAKEKTVPTKLPLMRVFFTLYTETEPCNTREECTRIVKGMQTRHMEELGLADIKYNFLVGGDGNVYEGRGWHVRSSKSLEFNPGFYDQRIDIAYIGDFRNVPNPPYHQLELGLDLLAYGEWLKHIHPTRDFYKLHGEKISTWSQRWLDFYKPE